MAEDEHEQTGDGQEEPPRTSSDPLDGSMRQSLGLVYQEICKTHNAIADFRAKLLTLLPIASGTGVFTLLGKFNGSDKNQQLLAPIGVFGIAVTVGLLIYELRGIEDCTMLRKKAGKIEVRLGITPPPVAEPSARKAIKLWPRPLASRRARKLDLGQFDGWYGGKLGLVDEIGAGWIVYLAVVLSWVYVASIGFADVDMGKSVEGWVWWPWPGVLGIVYLCVLGLVLSPPGRKLWVYQCADEAGKAEDTGLRDGDQPAGP